MIVKNAFSVLDFYSLFFILYSLFFILYSVSVAFLFLLFLTF
ncbi:putative membrane protein [Helicobacter pylori Hp P-16]|nr:putative membrane protein [Helicobacter pylori Hp P-16]